MTWCRLWLPFKWCLQNSSICQEPLQRSSYVPFSGDIFDWIVARMRSSGRVNTVDEVDSPRSNFRESSRSFPQFDRANTGRDIGMPSKAAAKVGSAIPMLCAKLCTRFCANPFSYFCFWTSWILSSTILRSSSDMRASFARSLDRNDSQSGSCR